MNLFPIAISLILLLAILFVIGNILTRKRHIAFTKADVVAAIENVLSTTDADHDRWDFFLSSPISDPKLEAIRQECLAIATRYEYTEAKKDISSAGEQKLRAILEELQKIKTNAR